MFGGFRSYLQQVTKPLVTLPQEQQHHQEAGEEEQQHHQEAGEEEQQTISNYRKISNNYRKISNNYRRRNNNYTNAPTERPTIGEGTTPATTTEEEEEQQEETATTGTHLL